MTGFAAVAVREVRQRRSVLAAALVAGFVALAVPAFSALGRRDVREARELAALVFAAAFAFAVALVTGGGMVTRELVERRHSFLFSRPLSAAAIWGGKVVAAWLLAVGSAVAVLLPAAALSGGLHLLGAVAPWGDAAVTLGIAAVALLTLVGFSHAGALMVRSRVSWLLAADVGAAGVVTSVVALALRSLLLAYALDAVTVAGVAVATALLVAPLVAGLVQVSLGRTDVRRGHRALSATLWAILGGIAALIAGYAHWVQSVSVHDVTWIEGLTLAPSGEWTFLTGTSGARGDYEAMFLLDTESGRAIKVGAPGRWWSQAQFSRDGTRAVWLSPPAGLADPVRDLMTVDLTEPDPRPKATPVTIAERGLEILGLSPDGRSVCIRTGTTVSVTELASGRVLASARLPGDIGAVRALWGTTEVVGLAAWNPGPANRDQADMRLFELDVRRRSVTETGRIAGVERRGFWFLAFDPERGRILTRVGARSAGAIELHDARTGSRLATLASSDNASLFWATFLAGGRLAAGTVAGDAGELRLFSPDGSLERTIPLGAARVVNLAAQPSPDTLVVGTRLVANDYLTTERRSLVVDLRAGAVTELARGCRPLASWPWRQEVVAPVPGSAATRAFIDPNGHLAVLDPMRGSLRVLLPARWFIL